MADMPDQRRDIEPTLITTAAEGRAQDIRQREIRYVLTQLVRVVCVLAAIFVPGWLKIPAIAGAIVLPWIAVTAANAGPKRLPGRPDGMRERPVDTQAAPRQIDPSRVIDAD